MKKLLLSAAVSIVDLQNSAFAEDNKKMEQVVVTAHRMEVSLEKIGSSVSVLNQKDIEANGAPNIANVIRTLPGISASVNGGAGKTTALRVRGEESYRTLVMIDGVKISDPTNTQVAPRIEHVSSANVERVEVLRGPQGMMYGADAGGVVNIITKRADSEFQGGLAAETGRYGSQTVSGDVRGQIGVFDYSLLASDDSVDGFNARESDIILKDDDGYDNTTLHANLGVAITEQLSARLVYRDVDAENEFDGCYGTDDCTNDYEQDLTKISLAYDGDIISHTLSYLENNVERQNYANGFATYGYEGKIQQGQYFAAAKLSDDQVLTFGIDAEEQTDEFNDVEQDQLGLLLEYQGEALENLSYSIGVRHDDNDDFGEHTTFRATAAYYQDASNGDGVKYKASYGTGFRAPSLYELNYNSAYGFAPATDNQLEEETSEGFDVGIEYYNNQGHSAELVYFYQEIDDAIDFDLAAYSGYVQEKGSSRSQGVELAGEYLLTTSLSITGNATYNDTTDTDGDRRARRPLWVANLGIQSLLLDDKLQINVDVRGSRGSIDNYGVELEDYEVVNINVSYDVTSEFEVYVRGENIFGKDYQEINDYNSSSEAFYVGARYRFDS